MAATMRWTRTLIPTIKETPEGAEIPSHVLMLRAGMIGRLMAGVYSYLPLGLRALHKAEAIIREQMDAAGAIELSMPALTPLALWHESGRAEEFDDELIRFSLRRRDRTAQIALAAAHEEVATELLARYVFSYRQLPLVLYQIRARFRNEPRPRLGVLRTCEFLVHDAYSFDTSIETLQKSYETIYAAYCRTFDRAGLKYLAAEASGGPPGDGPGHEFMVPTENGEDGLFHCRECGYAANLQQAEIGPLGGSPPEVALEPVRTVDTPGATTIQEVSTLLGCKPQELIKTLIYTADEKPLAVLVRGDHEANEGKIRRAAGAKRLELAPPEVIQRVTGAPVGFAGPVGIKEPIPIWADRSVEFMQNAVTGANLPDAHLTGVNVNRDFRVERFADLRNASDGDPCPRCSARINIHSAVKVASLFTPGTRYSEAGGARFVDQREEQHPIAMGSYQLGINRLLAAVIETSHDRDGIIWPVALAPYEVLVTPLKVTDPEAMNVADRLHDELAAAGIDVLLDDRDQRPGVKFKDADLIGIPLRVVIGERGLKQGQLELKWRWDREREMLDLDGAAEKIAAWIQLEREEGTRFRSRQMTGRHHPVGNALRGVP